MELIILASGQSSRFKAHGYKQSKYLLPFCGQSILDHLIAARSITKITIVYNESDGCNKDLQLRYRALISSKRIRLEFIPPHNRGPVYTLHQIVATINDHEPYAISYCDYVCVDLGIEKFQKMITDGTDASVDGAVLTYNGFHPHHIFPENIYGYLKVNKHGRVTDYREKSSFTNAREDEPCSAGMYFFSKGKLLKDLIDEVMINSDHYQINSELYVSMLYKALIRRGGNVRTIETQFFAQLGTPQDYEDALHWSGSNQVLLNYRNPYSSLPKDYLINAVFAMLLSGQGTRFKKEGYKTHKGFLKLGDKTIFEHIIDSLPRFNTYAFSVARGDQETEAYIYKLCGNRSINPIIIQLDTPNAGQADSARALLIELRDNLSLDHQHLPVYIAPCDSIITFDNNLEKLLRNTGFGVIASNSNPLKRLSPESYSYLSIRIESSYNQNMIAPIDQISTKRRLDLQKSQKEYMITGAFTSSSLAQLAKALTDSFPEIPAVNNEKYLDSFYELLLESASFDLSPKMIECSTYNSLGTPLEYSISKYWIDFQSLLGSRQL